MDNHRIAAALRRPLAHARIAAAVLAALGAAAGAASAQTSQDLRDMSLEELMNVEVTTVSRAPETSMVTPAAVYIITGADIRRSGATSLPEALRLAPGVQVVRIDAGKWAIGVRGFVDRLSRSMLVLIDGRPVYSPLFAGTYWETQHVPLDDVERIEVIRGPGGTLWGSNAVNGIVNIVTKSARDTQGALVSAAAGTEDRAQGSVRYGARLGDRTWMRTYVTGFDRAPQAATGDVSYDGWRLEQGGFRLDTELRRGRQSLTVQGDAYTVRLGELVRETSLTPPYARTRTADLPLKGGNVLARWSGRAGSSSDFQVQSSFEYADRDEYPVAETRRTFDTELVLRRRPGGRHRLVGGLGARYTHSDIVTAPTSTLPSGSERLLSAFVDDEMSVVPNRLRASLGVKLEHNSYSGLEVQPSVRLAWLVDADNTAWAAVTRAVRRPSRVERRYGATSVVDPAGPTFYRLRPNPAFVSEKLLAYEVGYRTSLHEKAYVTVAAFYDEWNDLLSTEALTPFEETATPPRQILPLILGNGLDGTSRGLETTVDARPTSRWRVLGTWSWLGVRMTPKEGSTDLTQESRYEKGSPRHQVRIQNSLDLAHDVFLDWNLRYVSRLRDPEIPGYVTSDVRVAWQPAEAWEVEAVGRGLHRPRQREWAGDSGGAPVAIQRSFYLGLTWRPRSRP